MTRHRAYLCYLGEQREKYVGTYTYLYRTTVTEDSVSSSKLAPPTKLYILWTITPYPDVLLELFRFRLLSSPILRFRLLGLSKFRLLSSPVTGDDSRWNRNSSRSNPDDGNLAYSPMKMSSSGKVTPISRSSPNTCLFTSIYFQFHLCMNENNVCKQNNAFHPWTL